MTRLNPFLNSEPQTLKAQLTDVAKQEEELIDKLVSLMRKKKGIHSQRLKEERRLKLNSTYPKSTAEKQQQDGFVELIEKQGHNLAITLTFNTNATLTHKGVEQCIQSFVKKFCYLFFGEEYQDKKEK